MRLLGRAATVRHRRALAAGLATAMLAAVGVTALAPAGQAAGAITVTSLSLGASSVSVSGLSAGHVTVTVDATITSAVDTLSPLVVRLARTSPRPNPYDPQFLWAPVSRTAAPDATHGTWSGTFAIPSTANGTWRVDQVSSYMLGPLDPNNIPVATDPRTDGIPDRTLAVVGTHRPVLTLTQTPAIAYPRPTTGVAVTFTGSFKDSDTGAPVAGVPVFLGFDGSCGESPGQPTLTTGATGAFSRRIVVYPHTFFCLVTPLPGLSTDLLRFACFQRIDSRVLSAVKVSAVVSPTSVRLGSTATVSGAVFGLYPRTTPPRAVLQKLVAGRWVTVNSAPVRTSGRYSLLARPGGRGTFTYRVVTPTTWPYKAAVSPSVRLTVV